MKNERFAKVLLILKSRNHRPNDSSYPGKKKKLKLGHSYLKASLYWNAQYDEVVIKCLRKKISLTFHHNQVQNSSASRVLTQA